jgi:hypothetical protein
MDDLSRDGAAFKRAALALFDEAYFGPKDPRGTWFTDNEPGSGFIGVLEGLDAARASERFSADDPATIASHAGHLRFSLSLANRAAKGENPYAGADWAASWALREPDEAAWAELVSGLRAECLEFRRVFDPDFAWADETFLTGALAQIAHGAWHLGAIRQALGMIRMPR